MKYLFVSIINLYQKIPFSSHKQCRFTPTCSNYAKEAILTYRSIKGTFLAIKRILKCNHFSKCSGTDPVPDNLKGELKWLI